MIPDFKALVDRVTENEGYRQDVYECSNGVPTVGIGFALKDFNPSPELCKEIVDWQIANQLICISKEHSQIEVANLLSKLHLQLTERYSWYSDIPPMVKSVLIEMCFQIGLSGVGKFKKALKAIENADWKVAADEMLDSKWARKDSPLRAERLADIVREHG